MMSTWHLCGSGGVAVWVLGFRADLITMDMPLAKRPPYVSHKDDRATRGRGSRVRSFQLHEELDFHALSVQGSVWCASDGAHRVPGCSRQHSGLYG